MDKTYDHKKHEKEIYKMWEDGGYFSPERDPDKKPYTIVLPPPNANGRLHVGHALMIATEDLLIRWKRMQGFSALWIPGTDHAGFETQVVFEKQLAKKKKSRFDFDRDTFYEKINDFVEEQRGVINDQMRSLGPSLDWSREKYTLEPDVIDTVYSTFQKMTDEGFVYRDNYMVNYCIHHGTTLADLEVEHKEKEAPLYYVRYGLVDRKKDEPEHIVVATTRPEPIFVDTHLAINPDDNKNKWLMGRKVLNPLTDEEMEIVADDFVDPEFGTGVVKLTPAHDKNDYEAAKRHELPVVPAFGTDGIIVEKGDQLAGLTIDKAREEAIEILESKDLIEKIDENYTHTIGVCYKCKNTIEPLVMPNWFIKVNDIKKPAHQAVKNGEIKIYPKWQEVKHHRWMEAMQDWPISRQIVWGIRIPAWYNINKNPSIKVTFLDKEGKTIKGAVKELLEKYKLTEIKEGLQTLIAPNDAEYVISKESPGENFLQETDTFDTWFSSGHWPLVTLDYPDSPDFEYFYPTSVLETGWEILRFWVSRMIMFGLYLTDKVPFRDVYLHGLVRAPDGRKMSKSLGNQIDPLEYVEEYGADALRVGLITGTATGKDFNFPDDKVIAYRNFANKIWNMARFMNIMFEKTDEKIPFYSSKMEDKLKPEDKSILEKLNKTIKEVNDYLENYKFAQAAETIYHFVWDGLASDYLEETKDREDKKVSLSIFRHVFINSLKLLHPFMPFVTEAIWQELSDLRLKKDPLIVSSWPETQ